MDRTLVSLDPDDKAWLMRKAKRERTAMAELVRRAIRQYRLQSPAEGAEFERVLSETAGLWRAGDGLAYQQRLRRDWARRK
jgi:hypothetical protein